MIYISSNSVIRGAAFVMHVVVCDDEPYYQEAVVRAVNKWSNTTGHQDVRCSTFSSSEDLLECWGNGLHIDLLFLDIEIPGEISGMSLAQLIRSTGQNTAIVFITNYDCYVYEGYKVNALRFLRKPIRESEIFPCMELVYKHIWILAHDRFVIDSADQHFVLLYSDIIYIEAQAHYLFFHLEATDEMPKLRARIKDVLVSLPRELFVQCHRGIVINLLFIRRFTKRSVQLSTGQMLPMSKAYFSGLHNAFAEYYQLARM